MFYTWGGKVMPKHCHECGEPIKEGNSFCENCGTRFYDQGMPGAGVGVAAMPKKHSGYGIASLVLGIVSMSLIWISFVFILYLVVELPMAIIATILGGLAYWGKWKDKYGLAGFILGLLVIIIGLVFAIIIPMLMWGRYGI